MTLRPNAYRAQNSVVGGEQSPDFDNDVESGAPLLSPAKYISGNARLQRKRKREIDMIWREKAWMLVDFLQIFALMWSLSQPWPWPYLWLSRTRWTLYSNVDLMGLSEGGAGMGSTGGEQNVWGERPGYLRYGSAFGLVPIIVLLLWLARLPFLRATTSYSLMDPIHKACLNWAEVPYESALVVAANWALLPVGLAVCRLLICQNGHLMVDPSVVCGEAAQTIVALVFSGVYAISCILLIQVMRTLNHGVLTYSYEQDHEKHLQLLEIEYALEFGDDWKVSHTWIVSSFRRHAVHYRIAMIAQKLALLVIYASLRTNLKLQAVLFWLVVSAWTAWTLIRKPYRCRSSNVLHMLLQSCLWFMCCMAMATGYGVRSSALVATSQNYWLSLLACLTAGFMFVYLTFVAFERTLSSDPVHSWPSIPTLNALCNSEERLEWIDAIKRAREAEVEYRSGPYKLVPIHKIEEHMQVLRRLWARAKATESLLELPLRETLESMAKMHEEYRPVSLMPGPLKLLAAALDDNDTKKAIATRHKAQLLMSATKRRILLKLFTLSIFAKHCKKKGSSKTVIHALTQQTSEALIEPVQPEQLPRLKSLCQQWKGVLLQWEKEFEQAHNVKPTIEDKRTRADWYMQYHSLHTAMDKLREGVMAPDIANISSVNMGRKELEEHRRNQEQVLLLNAQTEKLLCSKHDVQPELESCRLEWKSLIRRWEAEFEASRGHKPTLTDKHTMYMWYEQYHRVVAALRMHDHAREPETAPLRHERPPSG